MNIVRIIIAVMGMIFLGCDPVFAENVYRTTYGDVISKVDNEDGFLGYYDSYPKGFIYLENHGDGNYLGYWAQASSEQRCSYARRGRGYSMTPFWGRLEVQADGTGTFAGKWSYCDKNPSQPWDGRLK
ncbi:MAG: hypothetical protein HQL07_15125 [Nitrospirae bacterium]|nr:hypothetical protein [Magnetococcales bacterium]